MITISKPRVEDVDNSKYARLVADIIIDGKDTYPLWLQVESRYGKYLCHERSDAFVTALFHWAVVRGHDIVCEVPVTRELYNQLNDELIPMISISNKVVRSIKIVAPVADAVEKIDKSRRFAGTGGSCGVDALWTLKKHLHRDGVGDDAMDVTHLVCMRLHVPNADDSEENCDRTFNAMCANARALCNEQGLDFIAIDSNFDNHSLPGLTITRFTTYGPAFAAYALQKLFSYYYLASGYSILEFKMINEFINGEVKYELVLCPLFSTQSLSFYSSGSSVTRIEKVREIKDWRPAWHHLNVCMLNLKDGWRNCTAGCTKCYRTVLELLAVGGFENFSSIFDVKYVESHHDEYAAELLRGMLHHDIYLREVWLCRKGLPFTKRDWIGGGVIVLRKIFRKLLRFGKTGTTWHSR